MAGDSPSKYSRNELVEDARTFAETLEDAHPNPYSGHGGRVQFHRHLEELVRSIPGDGESIAEFYWRVQRLAAGVRDGHTSVVPPETLDSDVDGRFPVRFVVVGTALYVEAVYDEAYTDIVGGRLVAVNGVPVGDLREQQAKLESAENVYGDSVNLASTLDGETTVIEHLLDGQPTTLTLTVETPEEGIQERTVGSIDGDEPVETLETTVKRPETNGEPAYRFLGDGRSTALLVLPDCHSHREVHEIAAFVGGDLADFYDTEGAYRRLVGDTVPENTEDRLSSLPAATEIITNLVDEMATAGTETLVIDTRDNNGGSSFVAYLLVYILYGPNGVTEAVSNSFSVPKDSELYRQQYGDDGPVEATENSAGFDFTSYFEDAAAGSEELAEFTERSPTFAAEVESGEFAGYYRPETVMVVTSAETFSAGIEPGILLSKFGATIVGVPSGQAPNGPRDILFEELPNTGLEVRLSYRHHEFLPGESRGVFEPGIELTPARFEAFDRTEDAGVRLALAHANGSISSENTE